MTMHRKTLITMARELHGMSGVSIVRRHLREATHDALRQWCVERLVLTEAMRCD